MAGMTIGRKDGHAYLSAMEREAGVAGRMLGWGVLEGRVPPLWEVRPTDFPLVGEILDRATGVIVHSHYVEARVRARGYEGPRVGDPASGLAGGGRRACALDGSPLFGCFGNLNETSACRSCCARSPSSARRTRRAAAARRRRSARGHSR